MPAKSWFRVSLAVSLSVSSVLATTVLTQSDASTPRSNAPTEIVEWLRTSAIPLQTTNPEAELSDLRQLGSVIGNARIVAMGEATHGTREFFQMKHRMLEFLVEKMGFTVFAIEANWPESLAVNDYVLNGNGDPAAALAGMYFWTWNTEEVLDMIRWMRTYNDDPAHTQKVQFLGFDMQTARVAISNVDEYLENVDPHERQTAELVLAPLANEGNEREYLRRPARVQAETAEGIKSLLDFFDQHKHNYVAASSEKQWVLARHNLEIIKQAAELYSSRSRAARDRYMAENVKWILDNEPSGTKIMLWAHNGHVSTANSAMGSVLRRMYGQDMVVCGFSFYEGSFQAIPGSGLRDWLQDFVVGPAPPDALDSALAETGLPLFAIDLRRASSNATVHRWLGMAHRMRTVGAVYNKLLPPGTYLPEVVPDSFDVIFFVKRTTPARKNPKLPKVIDPDFIRAQERSAPDPEVYPPSGVHFLSKNR
jgi:erythromycin esterase